LNRTDQLTGKKIKRFRNKPDLRKDLEAEGVTAKGTKVELQALCKTKDTPIEEEIEDAIEGWEGKRKGMLQILWERGFIDPGKTNKSDCTLKGKKDAHGNIMLETSLKHLRMSLQTDFIEEETLLQCHGRSPGVKIERTPKCHPEIAGEGVKCDWGCSKGVCRHLPISEKRLKSKLRESVWKCIDRDEVLTVARRRLFSNRARECMLAHSIADNSDTIRRLVSKIQKLRTQQKCHGGSRQQRELKEPGKSESPFRIGPITCERKVKKMIQPASQKNKKM
jgi:hypothetical protein